MDKPCGRSSMRPMITLAVAIRLVWLLSLEYTDAQNASWLCPLAGMIFYLPVAFAINALSKQVSGCAFNSPFLKRRKSAAVFVSIFASLLLISDASASAHLLTNTADVMALGESPIWLLALPLSILVFTCSIFGIEAEGRSARIWRNISLPLLGIVIFVQFRNYQPAWLTPILGGGIKAVFRGAFYCAGYMALISLPWLIAVEDTEQRGILRGPIAGAMLASAILALLEMLTPPLVRTSISRSGRIELILSNGRVHLMLQLVTVILWFANLLHLLNAECTAASAFLQKALPRASNKLIAGITALTVFLCTVSGAVVNKPFLKLYSKALYPILCILIFVWLLFELISKRRKNHEQKT